MASTLYFAGRNVYNELGRDTQETSQLIECSINKHTTNIQQIIAGDDFAFYCNDDKDQNIWTAGYNVEGQCATNYLREIEHEGFHKMTYFQNRGIKIKKICTNITSLCVFWITETNQVYGNGRNYSTQIGITSDIYKLYTPTLIDSLNDVVDIQTEGSFNRIMFQSVTKYTNYYPKLVSQSKMEILRM